MPSQAPNFYFPLKIVSVGTVVNCKDTILKIFETNISRKGIGLQSQIPHSCAGERLIYSHDLSAFSAAEKYVDRSWKYINRSYCRHMNVETGTEAAQFLFFEYMNGIFVAVLCVKLQPNEAEG
jgi:hypothetical protein